MMLNLNNFTLVVVIGTEQYNAQSILALDRCLSLVDFKKAKIISCVNNTHSFADCITIPSMNKQQYNRFFIEEFHKYIDTDFCLTVQHDGFILDPNRWNLEFTKYDYIGAPWPDTKCINQVGNGGFSIRSKKFLDITSKLTYNPNIKFQPHLPAGAIPTTEDWFCCVHNYQYCVDHGIKFPNPILASQFSIEHPMTFKSFARDKLETYKSFGFHGDFNTAGMKTLGDNNEHNYTY